MKVLGLLVSLIALASCAHVAEKSDRDIASVNEPSSEVFERISAAATKAGYTGYDLTACFSKGGTHELVFGGVSSWNSALQILVSHDREGYSLSPTKRVTTDVQARTNEFIYKGDKLKLVRENPNFDNKGLVFYDAQMMKGDLKASTGLVCYDKNSGLE